MEPPTPEDRAIAILIVEDNDTDFIVFERAYKECGATNPLIRCKTGDEAVAYVNRRGEYSDPARAPRPKLIVLDLNLPGTDGRDVLDLIKSDARLRRIPVVVLSTSHTDEDIHAMYAAGANSYVAKPSDFQAFFSSVKTLMEYWVNTAELPWNGDPPGHPHSYRSDSVK